MADSTEPGFPPPLATPHAGVAAIAGAVQSKNADKERIARQLVAEAKVAKIVAETPLHPEQWARLAGTYTATATEDLL